MYQDKRNKNKVFIEQYKKTRAEIKSKKSRKYTILRRRDSNSNYRLDSNLEIFQR